MSTPVDRGGGDDGGDASKNDDKKNSNLSAMEAAVISMMKSTNLKEAQRGQVSVLESEGDDDEGTTKHAFWDTQVCIRRV